MSRHPRFTPLALAAVVAALPLLAAAHNYTYLEGGYLNLESGDDHESGGRIAGSADIHRNLALIGEYDHVDEVDLISAGAQFHLPLTRTVDWTAGATFEHVDADAFDDDGYGLRTGLRWQAPNAAYELWPELRYTDIADNSTTVRLGGLLALSSALDLQGAAEVGDSDRYELGLRYNFGPRLTGGAKSR